MKSLGEELRSQLEGLESKGLRRRLVPLEGTPGASMIGDGARLVNWASNNYLGLAQDARVVAAAQAALGRWGAGATASRLMGGNLEPHRTLESALASFKGFPAAAVFPSGYHANVGVLTALVSREDTLVLDRLSHASLVDGARLSGARLQVFCHNDPGDLERVLKRRAGRRQWVVTESVFSMDGDCAPLLDLVDVCDRQGASLVVDEAHATGVWGPEGRGLTYGLASQGRVSLCVGTLSKALGSQGGFVCGTREVIEVLHNRSRPFIYSTALAPASAAAAETALRLSLEEPQRREQVWSLAQGLRQGLGLPSGGPIVPWVLGASEKVVAAANQLRLSGHFVPAVRPPTVPRGTGRLRFSVTYDHTVSQISDLLGLLSPQVSA